MEPFMSVRRWEKLVKIILLPAHITSTTVTVRLVNNVSFIFYLIQSFCTGIFMTVKHNL